MTLSYWNSQFQFTKLLPDFETCLSQMQSRSDAVREELSLQKVAYGSHPRQWFEVSGQPSPGDLLPVFIHGGYWRALEAERHRFVLPVLKSITGAVANLEYRLMPEVRLSDIVDDACAGLRILSEQTSCRLVPVGHSAGGHLAVTCAMRLWDTVAGAVSISGLYDLTPLQWSFLREEIGLRPDDIEGHSPLEFWSGRSADRITVAVGARETSEFQRQAHIFASSHGARFLSIPDTHHMSVLDDLARSDGALMTHIADLIEEFRE